MAEFTPINTQEEFNQAIGARIQRERDTVTRELSGQISERDAKIKGFESQIADLTSQLEDARKQAGTVAELQAKIKGYETNSVKMRIAREVGLPYELAERLSGEDEKTIRSDAETLKKVFKAQNTAPMYHPSGENGAGAAKEAALKELLSKVRTA